MLRSRGSFVGIVGLGCWCASIPSSALADEHHEIERVGCDDDSLQVGWQARGAGAEAIAYDGVLPLPVSGGTSASELEFLFVDVRDGDGVPVVGMLEYAAGKTAVWRPAQPLTAGASYTCTLEADNAALAAAHPQRDVQPYEDLTTTWAFAAATATHTTVPVSALEVAARYVVVEYITGSDMVCCDGAYPVLYDHGGSLCYEGTCGSTYASGVVRVDVLLPAAPPEQLANSAIPQSYRFLPSDPEAPSWCITVSVTDLTTGEASEAPICFDAVAGQLGQLEFDPLPRLAAECSGVPYTCEITNVSDQGFEWDPDACTPWEGETFATQDAGTADDGDTLDTDDAAADDREANGCACATSGRFEHGRWGLLCVGFVALRRRRALRHP